MTDPTKPPEEAPPSPSAPAAAARASTLFPRGNPLRPLRGGVTAAVGVFLAFLLMAHDGQLPFGVPLGIVFVAIAALGRDGSARHLRRPADAVAASNPLSPSPGRSARPRSRSSSSRSRSPGPPRRPAPGGLARPRHRGLHRARCSASSSSGRSSARGRPTRRGRERPIWQRHGFWVIIASAVLLLPCLGSFSLWDPWETHYGEVAREILARDDWISTLVGAGRLVLVQAGAGLLDPGRLHGHARRALPARRDAARVRAARRRTPSGSCGRRSSCSPSLAIYLLYKGVARVFGRRAGLLGGAHPRDDAGLVVLAHQTMTDMPFVAPIDGRDGAHAPRPVHARGREGRGSTRSSAGSKAWRLSAWHLVFGAILLCAIPQILYLFSRNLELVLHGDGPYGFRAALRRVPGPARGWATAACLATRRARAVTAGRSPQSLRGERRRRRPVACALLRRYEPALQALTWAVVLGLLLFLNWGERRCAASAYLGGVVLRGARDDGQGAGRASVCRSCAGWRTSAPTQALERAPALRARQRPLHHRRASRSRGGSRCSCGTARRSPTGSSSTTWSTARSRTCTTPTRGTTRASASTSGSSATRSSRGRGSRRSGWSTGCGARTRPTGGAARRPSSCSCGSSSPSRCSASWGRSSTTTSCPRCRRRRCSSASCWTTCSAREPSSRATSRQARHRWTARAADLAAYLALLTVASALAVVGVARAWPGIDLAATSPRATSGAPSYRLSAVLCAAGGRPLRCLLRGGTEAVPRHGHRAHRTPKRGGDAGTSSSWSLLPPWAGRCSCSSSGATSSSSRRGPTSQARSGSSTSSPTTTGAHGPTSLDFSAILTGFTLVGAVLASRSPCQRIRKHVVVGVHGLRDGLGRVGPGRLHGQDGAALGPARAPRRLLRGPHEPGRAHRRLPDELERGELLLGQPARQRSCPRARRSPPG